MIKQLIIIGKGGHSKVCLDIALQKYDKVFFLDDNCIEGVLGPISEYKKYVKNSDFFVAIGNNETRERVSNSLHGANIVSLIHKNAIVAKDAFINCGTVIMAGAVVNSNATIGKGCIINTCSSIDHDNVVGDYSHVSVGSHLAGTVHLGKRVLVGAGSTIINNVSICDNVIIGAGSLVIDNIIQSGTFFGVPAVLHKKSKK